ILEISKTCLAIGPTVSKLGPVGKTPYLLITPYVGRRPVIPHKAAGIRTEPPVSVPIAASAQFAVTAAAEPPLDPPAIRELSQGFFVAPKVGLIFVPPNANSCILAFARIIPPALLRLCIIVASLE